MNTILKIPECLVKRIEAILGKNQALEKPGLSQFFKFDSMEATPNKSASPSGTYSFPRIAYRKLETMKR